MPYITYFSLKNRLKWSLFINPSLVQNGVVHPIINIHSMTTAQPLNTINCHWSCQFWNYCSESRSIDFYVPSPREGEIPSYDAINLFANSDYAKHFKFAEASSCRIVLLDLIHYLSNFTLAFCLSAFISILVYALRCFG